MKKNVVSKLLALVLAGTMVFAMAACGKTDDQGDSSTPTPSSSTPASGNESTPTSSSEEEQIPETLSITVGLPCDTVHTPDVPEGQSAYQKLIADIDAYTGMTVTYNWVVSATYYEQLGNRYAASNVDDVMVVGKDASFVSAAQQGLFWDVTDYIADYDNLAAIPQGVLDVAGVNGRLYGIPRLRSNAARSGFGYRQDWLNNVGAAEPKTWDQWASMLYDFTYKDPDGDGQNNTVGLGLDQWDGEWNVMMMWFGVPDTWGIDENGDLIHYTRTQEFKNALKAFRQLYEDGVINNGSNGIPDFLDDTLTPGKARDNLLRPQLAGAGIQVLDDLRKVQTYFQDQGIAEAVEGEENTDKLVFTLGNWLDTSAQGGDGKPHAISQNGGMNNMIAISTKNIKTVPELKRVLQFLNDLNDGDCLNLIEKGWEGLTWDTNADGYLVQRGNEAKVDEETGEVLIPARDASIESGKYNDGFNQMLIYSTAPENAKKVDVAPATGTINLLENKLYKEGLEFLTVNAGSAYTTDMQQKDQDTITNINTQISTMMRSYIKGEIDDTGLEAQMNTIWGAGLEKWTQEINAMYHGN